METIDLQIGMDIKGFTNLRKVLKRNLDRGLFAVLFVATSPEGEDREVKYHSVFGLLDYPVVIQEGDEVISMEVSDRIQEMNGDDVIINIRAANADFDGDYKTGILED